MNLLFKSTLLLDMLCEWAARYSAAFILTQKIDPGSQMDFLHMDDPRPLSHDYANST